MRQISDWSWRLSSSLTELRSVGAVVAFSLFFFPRFCAADESPLPLVKPDQYNVKVCEDYFNKLKPGLASGTSYVCKSSTPLTVYARPVPLVVRALLHEVGKVSGEARRMGCGKQDCVVEGSLLSSRKPAGFGAAGHTPSSVGSVIDFAILAIRNSLLSENPRVRQKGGHSGRTCQAQATALVSGRKVR